MKLRRQKQRPRGDQGKKIAVFGRSSGIGGKKQRCRRRIGQMKKELRKMKVGVMAAEVEAEAKLQGLVRTRNELMHYLSEMEATEALLFSFL
ncbi:hypothetical protein V6N13_148127 [Hibiscus sabdariffa]|uniref:Uncharacterized protein n=1 Tax=Hibiscus sabdariffa TaxID=183260 RepID=A0ABR2TXV8_9ROSI